MLFSQSTEPGTQEEVEKNVPVQTGSGFGGKRWKSDNKKNIEISFAHHKVGKKKKSIHLSFNFSFQVTILLEMQNNSSE